MSAATLLPGLETRACYSTGARLWPGAKAGCNDIKTSMALFNRSLRYVTAPRPPLRVSSSSCLWVPSPFSPADARHEEELTLPDVYRCRYPFQTIKRLFIRLQLLRRVVFTARGSLASV